MPDSQTTKAEVKKLTSKTIQDQQARDRDLLMNTVVPPATDFAPMNDWLNHKAKGIGQIIQNSVNRDMEGHFFTKRVSDLVEINLKLAMMEAVEEAKKCQII